MINIIHKFIVVILALVVFCTSMVCLCYHGVVSTDVYGTVVERTQDETNIYNCSLFLLVLSALALGALWTIDSYSDKKDY